MLDFRCIQLLRCVTKSERFDSSIGKRNNEFFEIKAKVNKKRKEEKSK